MTGFKTVNTTVCGRITNGAAAVRTHGYREEACCHGIGGASGRAASVVMRVMRIEWGALDWIIVCGICTISKCENLRMRGEKTIT